METTPASKSVRSWRCELVSALNLHGRYGLLATAAAAGIYLLMRRAFLRRVGGMTGDGAGALIEVLEAVSLIPLSLYR